MVVHVLYLWWFDYIEVVHVKVKVLRVHYYIVTVQCTGMVWVGG